MCHTFPLAGQRSYLFSLNALPATLSTKRRSSLYCECQILLTVFPTQSFTHQSYATFTMTIGHTSQNSTKLHDAMVAAGFVDDACIRDNFPDHDEWHGEVTYFWNPNHTNMLTRRASGGRPPARVSPVANNARQVNSPAPFFITEEEPGLEFDNTPRMPSTQRVAQFETSAALQKADSRATKTSG